MSRKMCMDALDFFGKNLLGRLYHSVAVTVCFKSPQSMDNDWGTCEIDPETEVYSRPREFVIRINNDLNIRHTLLTLAHEMVHVKQYARQEMKDMPFGRFVRWKRKTVDIKSMAYTKLPWEQEASQKEKELLKEFKKDCRTNKRRYYVVL